MFGKSKTKNSGMYNTISIPANLIQGTQSGGNGNGVLTQAAMLANNIDATRVMNIVPQWSQATNGNGGVTTISRSSNDDNIYITLTRGGGGSVDTTNLVTTNTNQTISGDKQFNSNIQVKKILEVINQTNDDIWANLECDNKNFSITTNNNVNIDIKNKKLLNVATPTNNSDCANKQYVDTQITNNKYQSFTTIKYQVNGIGSGISDTSGTQVIDYTNFENGFQMENQATYQIMLKQNVSNRDNYATCTICVNSVTYDNSAITTPFYGDTNGIDSVMFWVIINNNRLKLYVRRYSGTTTNGNTNTRVYIKKIAQGGIE